MHTKQRVKNLFKYSDESLDAILIKNGSEQFIDTNFYYVTGLTQGLYEECCLVLFPDGEIHIIVTELEHDIAKQADATIYPYKSTQEMATILHELMIPIATIGINASGILHTDYQWITTLFKEKKIRDMTKAFQKSRMIKDASEVSLIQKACTIADKVMDEIRTYVKKNMSENELAAEIDYHLQRYGARHPAFDTIASFGAHTALPHYTHDTTKLKNGDFVLCDFGACFKNYHSDITRTFVFGKASEKQKHLHKTVQKAQQEAMMLIRPGIQAHTVHDHVKSFIDTTTYKDCFIHSTGHSLGISVHDPGVGLNSTCEEPLQENMVLTVEPGIYIQGYGGVRIEDDIIITKEGCESFTKSSRSIQEI